MNMAKRKYSKMKKIEPSVQTLYFATPNVTVGNTGVSYIDLSQCASLVNRRFYRQGLNWAVSNITVRTVGQGSFSIQKLPNTWVMSNAWEKSFRVWQHMIKNATEESGSESIKGKFLDFKIFADNNHHRLGFGDNLLPVSFDAVGGTPYTNTPGQWQASSVFIPGIGTGSASEFDLIAVGPNDPGVSPATGNDAKSLIQGYADSRALPSETDPNVPDDAAANWQLAIFNDGTIQDGAVVQELLTEGDRPPYPYENDGVNTDTQYPGGETNVPTLETHVVDFVTGTTIGGSTRVRGTNYPCGLICVGWTPTSSSNLVLQVDLVPGTHRGYLCEPMTEM